MTRQLRRPVSGASRAVEALVLGALAGATLALVNAQLARAAERANPPKGRLMEVGGVRLHVVERGGGDPVLMLHGNGAMIEELEATGLIDATSRSYRAIALDRPGFGHSTRPSGVTWTPERQASLVVALLEELGSGPALVVGHSWGALLAAALAIHHPDKVRGLVLVSGYYFPSQRSDVLLGLNDIPILGDVMRHTVSPLVGRAAAASVIEQVFAPNQPTASFNRHYPVAMAVRPSQIRALGEDTALMMPAAARLAGRYREIACPAVILAGDSDRIVDTTQQSQRLARVIEQSELRIIDGVGHMVPHIEPMAVRWAIDRIANESPRARVNGGEPPAPARPI